MQFEIIDNRPLTPWVWSMTLRGESSGVTAPGQFVQLKLPGRYLRRPISVCDWTANSLRLVYKVVGSGTEDMTGYRSGMKLDVLTGLGNGYSLPLCGEEPLLVGGGVGLPPMLGLCRALIASGRRPTVVSGFGTEKEIFLREDFEALGADFRVATMDGTAGVRGLVTAAAEGVRFDSVCACGPLPMLKAIYDLADVPGQFSFEERMGCGFGACMGCTVKTKTGYKRICKDGPVLRREEILW